MTIEKRDKKILAMYKKYRYTYKFIGEKFGLTKQRIKQILDNMTVFL